MGALGQIDLPRRLSPVLPHWAGELIAAMLCLVAAAVVRLALYALAPGVAPFVLLFPATLIASLIGGWRAGMLTLSVSELFAWYFVVLPRGFIWKGEAQPANLLIILFTGLIMVGAVEAFRRVAWREASAGETKVAERDLLLRELEHRMKNNFQTVSALLEMQMRRSKDEPVREALNQALGRVVSISNAHRNLYADAASRSVDMAIYLNNLCSDLADALFLGQLVRLVCEVDGGELDRDRAVAVGLIVNELVTNAAKHAFSEGRPGQIKVAFHRQTGGYRLTVEDDGRGLPLDFGSRRQGMGRGLVEAFTRQAGGSLTVGGGPGAKFEVDLAA